MISSSPLQMNINRTVPIPFLFCFAIPIVLLRSIKYCIDFCCDIVKNNAWNN